MRTLLPLVLLCLPAPLLAFDEAPFEPSRETFADEEGCTARLSAIAAAARAGEHVAVEGPYAIGPGDIRIHSVLVAGSGHRITEHRCLGAQLGSRTWTHVMDGSEDEGTETIDSMAAKAEWLKKPSRR